MALYCRHRRRQEFRIPRWGKQEGICSLDGISQETLALDPAERGLIYEWKILLVIQNGYLPRLAVIYNLQLFVISVELLSRLYCYGVVGTRKMTSLKLIPPADDDDDDDKTDEDDDANDDTACLYRCEEG